MRAWLYSIASVPATERGPLLTKLGACMLAENGTIAGVAREIAVDHARHLPMSALDALVDAMPDANTGEILELAATRGSAAARSRLERSAAEPGAAATLRFLVALLRGDVPALHALYDGADPAEREALAGLVVARAARDPSPDTLAAACGPMLVDASVRLESLALASAVLLAERGVVVKEALAVAQRGLGDEAKHEPQQGTFRVRSHGATCAALLGLAMATQHRADVEAVLDTARRSKKRAVREHAAYALGIGLRADERWSELGSALTATPRDTRESLVAGLVGDSIDREALVRVVTAIRAAGIEPRTLASLRHLRVPGESTLTPEGVAVLVGMLGTADRGAAVRALGDAARAGARLGPLAVVLAGVLLCGDYVDPYPFPVLEVLAVAARREGPSPATPFLGALVSDSRPDVCAAACEIAARSGRPFDASMMLILARRPFELGDAVAIGRAIAAARHATEALDARQVAP
jgi:hypothetical protein